ncbi:MAG: MFS transporter [Deltaproteobacteria bacterium]|nr:MFS transporter [Deltaproteobacteria bacterium]
MNEQQPESVASAAPSATAWRSRNVVTLGTASLCTDVASEMVMPLLPTFLQRELGGGPAVLGRIEGTADAVSSVLKLFAGRWADRLGRNVPLIVAGYLIASAARPLVALARVPWHVLAVRVVDRVGKGIRTSPRDALIAASVPAAQRGRAFGFHRAMDHTGAVIGPLVAAVLLSLWSADLRRIFGWAALPGGLAVLVLLFGAREAPAPKASGGSAGTADEPLDDPPDGLALVRLLVPIGLFGLGKASDVFLLVKASATRAPLLELPLLWMVFHLVKATVSVPGGQLADRIGARGTIVLGWLVHATVFVAFAFAEAQWMIWTLFVVYGVHHGLTEGAEKALVASLARTRRGTAFGWYHLTVGLIALPASALFGQLWDGFGPRVAFLASAGLAAAAVLALVTLVRVRRP